MKKYLIIFLLYFNSLDAIEVFCHFEEVHQDGSVQQGLFLLKDDFLRYQYLDKNLYTIINNKEDTFVVSNKNRLTAEPLTKKKEIIQFLIDQATLFPKNLDFIENNTFRAQIIKSKEHEFIRKIIIHSDEMNFNIYFNQCEKKNIKRILFKHSPLQILTDEYN